MPTFTEICKGRIFQAVICLGAGAVLTILLAGFDLEPDIDSDVLAALIGNFGLIGAALLTVVFTAQFTAEQYGSERAEKAKDRALQTKKELLVDSVRGANMMIGAVSAFSDLTRPVADITRQYQEGNSKLVAAAAVASLATVHRGAAFVKACGPELFCAVEKRIPLEPKQQALDALRAELAHRHADNQRMVDMQRDAIAARDDARAETLHLLIEAGRNLAIQTVADFQTAEAELLPAHAALIRHCVASSQALQDPLNQLIDAIRADIDIEGSSDEFLNAIKIDPTPATEALERLLGKLSPAKK